MPKAYKLTILVIDHDALGGQGVIQELENANYPNDCISPRVVDCEEKDLGEWTDDNPLNHPRWQAHFKQLFSGKPDA